MIGEVLFSVALEAILREVISLANEEIRLVWGFKEELRKLRNTLTVILAVLEDAEKQQEKYVPVRIWLARVKDVAYDAEDVLDEFAYEKLRGKMEIGNRMKNKVRNFFSPSNPLAFQFKMVRKIKSLNAKLDDISQNKDRFEFRTRTVVPSVENKDHRETYSRICDEVVGRENEKSEIVDMLISSSNQKKIPIIPIVGIGGIGKTTLAKLVYNDDSVVGHFNIRIWVWVSEDFNAKKILSQIKDSVDGRKCDNTPLTDIMSDLQEKLSGKKVLLVLDDVWNEDPEKWHYLGTALLILGANSGSKILVTTRSGIVASIMGPLATQNLGGLSDDECWSLFRLEAFENGGPEETPNLIKIGKEMVKKCKGVPLAVKALGSLMYSKKNEDEWVSVKNNETLNLHPVTNEIIPALKLSYDHLPSILKQCLSYCSIFPKDCEIKKEMLIHLWMAEGLLQPSKSSKKQMEDVEEMEDVGGKYFNTFLQYCFFQDIEKDEYENIWKCKMHGLVHDLAQWLVGNESSVVEVGNVDNISEIRHFPLFDEEESVPASIFRAKKLRTFLSMSRDFASSSGVFDSVFLNFKYLRVLSLSGGTWIKELSSSIRKLKHLKYIDLSSTQIEKLPESITRLYQLQTLKLQHCNLLKELPKDMRKMISLRHLMVHEGMWNQMPTKIGKLIDLQTLPIFKVGIDMGCGINELRCLNKLRGELKICNLENVRNRTEAKEANLKDKPKIHHLKLLWGQDNNIIDDVLEGLQPHPNLKALTIENFGGVRIPSWFSGSILLPNLVKIEFYQCYKLEHVPMLGQLLYLRVLKIYGKNNVKCIGAEFYYGDISRGSGEVSQATFPSLRELTLFNMDNLEKWVEVSSELPSCFPRLEELYMGDCPRLTTMPSRLTSLTSLRMEYLRELEFHPEWLLQNNTNVRSMVITDCPKVEAIVSSKGCEGIHREIEERLQMQALKTLEIRRCSRLKSIIPDEWSGFTSLRELIIDDCHGLTCLPDGLHLLKTLEMLFVSNCPNLMYVPDIQGLIYLKKLVIRGCKQLQSLPKGLQCLSTLEELSIGGFSDELDYFPKAEGIQHLTSLRSIKFYGWPKLKSLPEEILHLTTLQNLSIISFDGLVILPESLGDLTSLQNLKIKDCKNLKYLPTEEAVRRPRTLINLKIKYCSLLGERCAKETGEEWFKIAHLPFIWIDGIQQQDFSKQNQQVR